jgi:DNA-binding transcriptional regulator YiaG
MTNEEYKAALATLSLSRRRWAALIEAAPRAVQNRADGTSGVSGAEEKLLKLLLSRQELIQVLEAME